MSPFSFLQQRVNLAEAARTLNVITFRPSLTLEGLMTGVDNIRHDVALSPRFMEVSRLQITKLIVQYGSVEQLAAEEPKPAQPDAALTKKFVSAVPKTAGATTPLPAYKGPDVSDFKRMFTELHIAALNMAKQESNISLDLLARLAILKFLRHEAVAQYGQALERCRARMKTFDGPRVNPDKALEMREKFAQFQINKRTILRKAGQDLFTTLREIEKETLSRMRRSLFGDALASSYDLFLNRLLFTEDARDDYLNAEQYVMLGNYDRDPDRFQSMLEYAVEFLKQLNLNGIGADERAIDDLLNVPENAIELVGGGSPDENTATGKAQRAILAGWVELLEQQNVMDNVVASYEAVPLLGQYAPLINAQQLKNALISKTERKRVESFLEEHGRISTDALNSAVKRVDACKGNDRLKMGGRFLTDFMRYHRDLRRFEAVISAMDSVNVIQSEKLHQLSAINNTLYEFLLPEEQKPAEEKVVRHIILKADIRDSTTLTRTLMERGLNPASYFSLNFYDPINKLLPKYDATKVFIEGDAVILALFEREGEVGMGVARTCVLAKEMIGIVSAYNQKSAQAGLPVLELGIGICYQDSAPLYLMDGNSRIMISKALNESDRLSGCTKGARKYLAGVDSLFNVFSFQTVDDEDTGGIPEEFLMRYNIGGIHINELAFKKLMTEISLQRHTLKLPMLWETEEVPLYSGLVPVGPSFHRIVVREGRTPHINASDFSLKRWTERKYFEVCTNATIYEYVESAAAKAAEA